MIKTIRTNHQIVGKIVQPQLVLCISNYKCDEVDNTTY